MASLRRLLVTPYLTICHKCTQMTALKTGIRLNSNRAAFARPNRSCYARTYPTVLVLPDGATINIRYKEPRQIVKLPLDLNSLSEEERQRRLLRRKPKRKIVIQEEIEDSFDANKYSHLWKK